MGQRLLQGGSMLLFALVLLAVGRWGWRHMRTSAPALLGLGVLFLIPFSAGAAVIETGQRTYVVERDRLIANDLIVTAETVRIEGTIDGDLLAAGQTVVVTGRIMGDVIAFCQRLQVEGQVDGSVRSGSEFLDVSGRVGRNVTSAAQTVEIAADASVDGSVTLGAERIEAGGRIGRDIIVGAERIQLDAAVGGGALMAATRLAVGPTAEIQGEARYYGTSEPEVSPQARLARPLDVTMAEETPAYASPKTYVRPFLRWAAAFLLGLTVVLVLPGVFSRVLEQLSRYGMAILLGAAALVVIPVLAVLVLITLVGIPLGLVALFLYAFGLYGAQVFVGAWIGREILGPSHGQSATLGRLALGLGLLHAVGYVPYVGKIVSLVVALWGLGALLMAATRRAAPVSVAP